MRNPDKPVVSFPMAKTFNEKVSIDLSFRKDRDILHMIDMYSRLPIFFFIVRKKPGEVIDKVMEKWIGFWLIMAVSEVQEVKDILNVVDQTKGAESPWMNGLWEKKYALVNTMLERGLSWHSWHVLLSWANKAKNSKQMVYCV